VLGLSPLLLRTKAVSASLANGIIAGMPHSSLPVEWHGRQAVVVLPEYVDLGNAGQLRDQLLALINRGAAAIILDMTKTASCDHAGMDAVTRAYQRAVIDSTPLRLAVAAPVIRRMLSIEGLDRLVSIYPTVAAALAAGPPDDAPAAVTTRSANGRAHGLTSEPALGAITPAVLWQVIDALGDGLALTRDNGEIVLVNRRCAEMFGYQKDELVGRLVESLVPADLRAAHESYRAQYVRMPTARPMSERARLVGACKDGATIPVEVSLSPVPTATGHLILAVIRDTTQLRRHRDLADLARAAAAEQTRRSRELLDTVVHSLFQVGISLQTAADLPGDVARDRISEAVARLDDIIHEIRSYAFDSRGEDSAT
jgi:anti-anti-sigma factor